MTDVDTNKENSTQRLDYGRTTFKPDDSSMSPDAADNKLEPQHGVAVAKQPTWNGATVETGVKKKKYAP